MNEGFFGQYSVFCVFGSVVGCVVVPLIAQVLQQQSMECVILSAIVISLTAAHLNKKGGNDPTYSKILLSKELERKKINHNNNNSHKKQKNQAQQQHLHNSHQLQLEQDYMQQHEHLKNIEMERRSEEKRLKKLRKREERLKKREEENRKQKELEEHYRNLKEKRLKQQKENYHKTNKRYLESAGQNLEKFCGTSSNSENKRCGLTTVDTNRVMSTKPTRTVTNSNNSYYQQKIPRFERHRTGSCASDSVKSSNDENNSTTGSSNNLTIKCNLSASCSSLSSISSSDSASPPMSLSQPCTKAPWVMPASPTDSLSGLPALTNPKLYSDGISVTRAPNVERSLKSYSNSRVTKTRPKLIPDSSSLFCSQLDGLKGNDVSTESQPIVGEYSLFGPQPFVTSFARSPVL